MQRSRLTKQAEKQSKKNITISLAGIVVVLFILFKFGVPFLLDVSSFFSKNKDASVPTSTNNNAVFVAPPVLDPIPSATNSAPIKVSGKASDHQIIELFLNDNLSDKTTSDSNGSFSFDSVNLNSGDNTIKVKAKTNDNKESDFSNASTITLKKGDVKLDVSSPSDGQQFNKDQNSATITGKTDTGNRVTVNGFQAIVDSNGNYSYIVSLQNGDNKIIIDAADPAGNKTEKQLTVRYSQ